MSSRAKNRVHPFLNVIPSEARDLTIEIESPCYSKVRSLTPFGGFGMTTSEK